MNLSKRIWSRASKDRAAPKANELIGYCTEVWGAGSREGHPPKGGTREELPNGQGHLTQGEDI